MPSPEIEVLYFADCPHYERALALVQDVLRAERLTLPIKLVTVETEDEARARAFHGSPTIRIAGADVAPVPAGSRPALACRMYRDADGRPSPTPPRESVVAALRRAAGEGERV